MPQDRNNKKKNATSNLKTIKDIGKKGKTKAELEKAVGDFMILAQGQDREIKKLQADLEQKQAEIVHLKKILEKSVPILGSEGDVAFDEVTIAQIQLDKLGKIAAVRELNNEEARKFEIFARVLQNDAKLDKPPKKNNPLRDVTPAEILKIAQKKAEHE